MYSRSTIFLRVRKSTFWRTKNKMGVKTRSRCSYCYDSGSRSGGSSGGSGSSGGGGGSGGGSGSSSGGSGSGGSSGGKAASSVKPPGRPGVFFKKLKKYVR